MGGLELKTNPKPMGELPLPADFPAISNGSVVTAGAVLSGSLSQPLVQHADLNGDDRLDAADIDHVFAAIRAGSQEDRLDLNDDQHVDDNDGRFFVEAVFGSSAGDANLDRVFDSHDPILTFQQGQYEDSVPGNSGWSSSDWNGDGDFDSSDLIAASQTGRYR